jgi:CubicO group peptidase (beta-lactamase class C family)
MKPLSRRHFHQILGLSGTAWATECRISRWPSATPRNLGLDEQVLAGFDADIGAGKYGYVDSMLVIRHGSVAYDRTYAHDYDQIYGADARKTGALNAHEFGGPYNYFNPWWHPYYRREDLHTLQSVSKTVTSVIIGVAVTRNQFPSIDTPVLEFFSDVANVDDRKRRMKIRHLLTMTAGFEWNEGAPYDSPENTCSIMEASADWIRYVIDRPMAEEPGARFNYNSGATQLLAHIFARATGADIEEYGARNLFAPLGIPAWFWKRTPWGLPDTEGGLYLHRHDLARITYLFHRNGDWNGAQIVSPEWVKSSLEPSISVTKGSEVQYGFKWWLYHYPNDDGRLAFGGSGFGGQMPIVIPKYELVLVFNGWNILGDKHLRAREAIDRVVAAVSP